MRLQFERVDEDVTIRIARIKCQKSMDDIFLVTFTVVAKNVAARVVAILTADIYTGTNGHFFTLDNVFGVLNDNAPVSIHVPGSKGFQRQSY